MEGDLQRTVGTNIRRIRAAGDLSQEDLAELLGHHRTYVGAVERGERNLSLRALERLAGSLGVDPVDLLAGGTGSDGATVEGEPGAPPAVT
ncbi:helix-turn-helix domain-containing protein [Cellulomonas pakistanensis]|uniref:helix-turn-helix domain-containing protein n=1 Tax=Cellulomonas pakistanensis TaxID=992287 RepID=UPI001EF28DA3|nr:helix-turn-helix transcriptional regulator [Cellulomonas pakistanensis]